MTLWPHALLLLLIVALFVWERHAPDTVNRLEENLLVSLLSLITVVSFGQVVARYMFNTGWAAALEFVMACFSWMILFGMAYGLKRGVHLGVDIALKRFPAGLGRWVAMGGAASGAVYALLLLDATWLSWLGVDTRSGAIDYWSKMYKINIGAEELRWPTWLHESLGWKDRVPRWLVLMALPISLALLAFRSLQAMVAIYRGERAMVIAGHEAEELVQQNQGVLKDN